MEKKSGVLALFCNFFSSQGTDTTHILQNHLLYDFHFILGGSVHKVMGLNIDDRFYNKLT